MTDLVVTVPKGRWKEWLAEGDCAGDAATGQTYEFFVGTTPPPIAPGERLYIVAWGLLRGWAPVVRAFGRPRREGGANYYIVRGAGAEACTLAEPIRGFQGWRKVHWLRSKEQPFEDWKTRGVKA